MCLAADWCDPLMCFCIAARRHQWTTFDDDVHAGDFAAAAAAFAAGLAMVPQDQPLHKTLAANLSAAHERLGDFTAALQAANAAAAAAPLWSKAHLRCRMHYCFLWCNQVKSIPIHDMRFSASLVVVFTEQPQVNRCTGSRVAPTVHAWLRCECNCWLDSSTNSTMKTSSAFPTCRRGRALIGLKRFGAAAEALEHCLVLSPGDAGAQQV